MRVLGKGDSMEINKSEQALFKEISNLIESCKANVAKTVNGTTTLMFWQIGKIVNGAILQNKRAEYGKQIVSLLAAQLKEKYGKSFELRNLRRMIQFSEQFDDFEIVSSLMTQLSRTHIIQILSLKKIEAKLFYAEQAAKYQLTVRKMNDMISRKAFERKEIANAQIVNTTHIPFNTFKDPYLLDMLNLSDDYLENDLETAILKELENFILEFGRGFTFVERQKRMIIDGNDFHLDLLFYNRVLKRLIAVELKVGKFRADYKGQMELYLKWLDKYAREEGENAPIGLILCSDSSDREQIELLEMHKDGIIVAEYWTELPPKKEFEQKIHALVEETKERIERKMLLQRNMNEK